MSRPDALRFLRPMGTGELLDRAFALFRAEFRQLVVLAFGFQLVSHSMGKVFELVGQRWFPLILRPTFLGTVPKDPGALLHQASIAGVVVTFVMGFALTVWQLSIAAVAGAPEEAPGQRLVRPAESWLRLLPALPRLVPTLLLELVLLGLAAVLGALPGALAGFAGIQRADAVGLVMLGAGTAGGLLLGLGMFLVALLRFVLVGPVVAVEGLSGIGALRRSAQLMGGVPGQRFIELPTVRGSVLMLVLGMVTNSIILVVALPRLVLLALGDATGGALALPVRLLIELMELTGETVVAPFGMVCIALFYADLRMRREGQDLRLRLERLPANGAAQG